MGNFKWDLDLAKKLLSEFTGTAMLMALGCSISQFTKSYSEIALGWGFTYAATIHIFAFLSGAHINPWVSVAATIVGHMGWELMLCYIACQLLGSLLGFGMAFGALPENSGDVCLTMAGPYFDEWKIIFVEFILCGLLLFAYCAIWDNRSKNTYDSFSIRIGFLIAGICYSSHFYSGCSLNFFRSFAPALIQLKFDGLWCHLVGQVLAVLVPVLWRFVIADGEPEKLE